jgi:hypothetical protein
VSVDPVWQLKDADDRIVASTRAPTALEARELFKREGQQGARVVRAEVAPVDTTAPEPGARCTFCGEHPIDPEQDYQHIQAWRAKRHGNNSPNYVRAYEQHDDGKWACRWCIDKLANGVSPHQQTLT